MCARAPHGSPRTTGGSSGPADCLSSGPAAFLPQRQAKCQGFNILFMITGPPLPLPGDRMSTPPSAVPRPHPLHALRATVFAIGALRVLVGVGVLRRQPLLIPPLAASAA